MTKILGTILPTVKIKGHCWWNVLYRDSKSKINLCTKQMNLSLPDCVMDCRSVYRRFATRGLFCYWAEMGTAPQTPVCLLKFSVFKNLVETKIGLHNLSINRIFIFIWIGKISSNCWNCAPLAILNTSIFLLMRNKTRVVYGSR